MTRWFPAIVVLALVGVGVGLVLYFRDPGVNPENLGPNAGKERDDKPIVMTAEEAIKDTEIAWAKANTWPIPLGKYEGRIVEITGRVGEINRDSVGVVGIDQKDAKEKVWCAPASTEKAYRLSLGQKIKITGKPDPIGGGPRHLVNCSIAELEPSALLHLTAPEIADILDEGDSLDELTKIGLLVSGTVRETIPDESDKNYCEVRLNGSKWSSIGLSVKLPAGRGVPAKGDAVFARTTGALETTYSNRTHGANAILLSDQNMPEGVGKKPVAANGHGKHDMVSTPDEMAEAWATDAKAAEMKFRNKIVALTVKVEDVYSGAFLDFRTSFQEKGGIGPLAVHCDVNLKNASKLAKLQRGQQVKLVGRCTGKAKLTGCSLTEIEPSKSVEVAAENLAKELEANPNLAADICKERALMVSGVLLEVARPEFGTIVVRLAGTDKTRISFEVPWPNAQHLPRLKGTTIEMRALYFAKQDNGELRFNGFYVPR